MALDLPAVPLLGGDGDIDIDFEDDQHGAESRVDTNIRSAQENDDMAEIAYKQVKACSRSTRILLPMRILLSMRILL
jgi:hypothetical protein